MLNRIFILLILCFFTACLSTTTGLPEVPSSKNKKAAAKEKVKSKVKEGDKTQGFVLPPQIRGLKAVRYVNSFNNLITIDYTLYKVSLDYSYRIRFSTTPYFKKTWEGHHLQLPNFGVTWKSKCRFILYKYIPDNRKVWIRIDVLDLKGQLVTSSESEFFIYEIKPKKNNGYKRVRRAH